MTFWRRLQQLDEKVTKCLYLLAILVKEREKEKKMFTDVQTALTTLQADVTNETTVVASVEKTLNGIPALISDAVSKALAKGATPEQLQAFADLSAAIEANTTGLTSAVVANTSVA